MSKFQSIEDADCDEQHHRQVLPARPKNMTNEELEALPVGPLVETFIPHTIEDIKAGALGRGRMHVEMREVLSSRYLPDDIFLWWDKLGRNWSFGQFADGSWFKQPAL